MHLTGLAVHWAGMVLHCRGLVLHCRGLALHSRGLAVRKTGSIQDYVDRFLDPSSRLPNLADAVAKYALINGLKSEVQIHLLGQAHVTTLREALAELRVYAQARRGAQPHHR